MSRDWAAAIEAHFADPPGEEFQVLSGPGGLFGDGPPFDPLRMLVERSRLFREGGEGAGVIGPNMIMSARAWRDIRDDLIDDDAIYEDVDVSHRLAAHGYKAWFSPQVAVEQSPRQLRHSPWQNRRYLVGGYRLARARHDRKLAALFVLEMPFRFALYTVYWLTFRPWDPGSRTWRPHRLFTRLERERPLISDGREGGPTCGT